MATLKLVMSGDGQLVHLPREFCLDADEVEATWQGSGILLEPRSHGSARFLDLLSEMSEEAFEGIRDERRPEERDGR